MEQVEAAYKRLVEEVSSAQRLRDRAEESLATTQPEDGHGQALTSAAQARPPDSRSPTRSCLQVGEKPCLQTRVFIEEIAAPLAQAIFSHQGLRLEAELDELRQAITQAEAALAAAAAALQAAGLVRLPAPSHACGRRCPAGPVSLRCHMLHMLALCIDCHHCA